VIASNSNAAGRWLGDTPLAQLARSPHAAVTSVSALITDPGENPRIAEGARLVRVYSTPGRQPAVLIRADYLTAVLLAGHRGNALPIVNGNQEGLVDDAALKRVVAATDRLPEGSFVVTETMFMRLPPQAFAHFDPVENRRRFGDYFLSRSYGALAERFPLRVVERGRFGYVVLQVGRHR